MDKIDKAFKTISGYCAKISHCEKCRFLEKEDEDKICILRNYIPADWISQKGKGCN